MTPHARSSQPAAGLPRLVTALAACSLALACRSPGLPVREAAPSATVEAPSTPTTSTDGEDPGVLVIRAWRAHQEGDVDRALALLSRADALGLDIPQDARDFPKLADRAEWKALAARVSAREPETGRATVAVTLREPGLVAEGIAAAPDGETLYVSSIRRRKIVRIGPGGVVSDFVAPGAHGLLAPLGMKVDAARGLLWTACNASSAMEGWEPSLRGQSALFAFDLRTGELRRKVVMGGSGEDHFLNDVAVAGDGTVFVTDSNAGAVHRLAPGADALTPAVSGGFFYPNGIVVAGDHVVFAHALGLHAFPVAGGEPFAVRGPARFPLGGIDGLAIEGSTVFAVQNALGKPRIVRLELDRDERGVRVASAAVVETANPSWRVPTTGAFARGAYLYIGNSFVDALSESGVSAEAMAETLVLQLPVR